MSEVKTRSPFFGGESTLRTTFGTIGLIVTLTAAGVLAWARANNNIEREHGTNERQDAELSMHEVRIRTLEQGQTTLAVVQNDVQWIRKTIEAQQQREGRRPAAPAP